MSRLLRVLLVGAIVLSLTSMAEAKTITIKAVTAWPKSVWEVGNFMKFMDIVKERVAQKYAGQLEIQYAGGPEVIPNQEQVEAAGWGGGYGLHDRRLLRFSSTGGQRAQRVHARRMGRKGQRRERLLDKIHQEKVGCVYLGRLATTCLSRSTSPKP